MGKEQWLQVVLALATPLATLTIVMVGFLYNNSRLSDFRSEIIGRFSDLRSEMNIRFNDAKEVNDANLRRLEDMLLGKFAELDTRLSRIESHLNMR